MLGSLGRLNLGAYTSTKGVRDYEVTKGTPLFDWATVTTGNVNGASVVDETTLESTKAGQLPYNASRAYMDVTIPAANLSGMHSFRVRVSKQGAGLSVTRIFFTGDGFGTFVYWDILVPEGDSTFVLRRNAGVVNGGFTWASNAGAINTIRIRDVDTSNEAGANYVGMTAGQVARFGLFTVNPMSRPKFLVQTDDGYDSNVVNGAGSGYPASGKNYLDILNYYGLKGTAYIIPGLIDTGAPWMTTAHLNTLKGAGWSLGSHSNAGSGNGLVDLGSQAAVYTEVTTEITGLETLGFPENANHFSLPQGAFNYFVLAALEQIPTLKTVRSIGNLSPVLTNPMGRPGGQRLAPIFRQPGNARFITSSYQMDGGTTTSEIDDYLASVIAEGATGSSYTHSINGAIATAMDYLCSRLADLQSQGLIDVVTIDQWHRGL